MTDQEKAKLENKFMKDLTESVNMESMKNYRWENETIKSYYPTDGDEVYEYLETDRKIICKITPESEQLFEDCLINCIEEKNNPKNQTK